MSKDRGLSIAGVTEEPGQHCQHCDQMIKADGNRIGPDDAAPIHCGGQLQARGERVGQGSVSAQAHQKSSDGCSLWRLYTDLIGRA
jgi:hypothetical protein